MEGFLIVAVVVAGVVMLFRYLRRREIDAFLDADVSQFSELAELRAMLPSSAEPAPALNVVRPGDTGNAGSPTPAAAANEGVTAREALFDDPHRECLRLLDLAVAGRARIFVKLPLADVARGPGLGTRDQRLSFVLATTDLTLICGVHLGGQSSSEKQQELFLRDVFGRMGKPLVVFGLIALPSLAELEEALAPILDLPRHCPKCGEEMRMKKAVKGPNSGRSFWVCRTFPSCRGILRIG